MLELLYKIWLKPSKSTKTHLLCWSIFIVYEVVLSSMALGGYSPFIFYFLFYLLNISLFYFHALVVLRGIRSQPEIYKWLVPIFTICELLIYFFISYLFSFLLSKQPHSVKEFSVTAIKYIPHTLWRGISFLLYSTGYYFVMRYVSKKEKTLSQEIANEQLKNQLLLAEQDFLRAQINPHLLFNTLSFIKYAARKKPEEADEAIMRLSEIMDFALENNSQTILLSRELQQVEHLIRLNQLRYNHTLHINLIARLDHTESIIIPILLLTLVENIFKHGNLVNEAYPAEISIEATEDHMIIKSSNLPNNGTHIKSTKTGLLNTRLRLEQTYKNNFEMHYGMEESLFKVYIKINL